MPIGQESVLHVDKKQSATGRCFCKSRQTKRNQQCRVSAQNDRWEGGVVELDQAIFGARARRTERVCRAATG